MYLAFFFKFVLCLKYFSTKSNMLHLHWEWEYQSFAVTYYIFVNRVCRFEVG